MRVNLSLTCTGRAMNQTLATLPGGRAFDPGRPRWRGPLDAEELAWCRANGVALGYDPAQIGWVALAPAAAAEAAPDEGPDEAPDEAPDAAPDAAPEEALRLRPWRAEDAPDFRALLDDPEIWRHLPEPYPAPLTAALAADLIALAALPHHDVRAIERGGAPVGQVRLAFPPGAADRRSGEISYWLGRRWWGRGIASAAIRRFTGLCFAERPDLEAIFARVHRDNAASARAVARAGYRDEGPAPDDPAIRIFRRRRSGGRA
jgi:RimJ/RimL family protein N-acetyltransferase